MKPLVLLLCAWVLWQFQDYLSPNGSTAHVASVVDRAMATERECRAYERSFTADADNKVIKVKVKTVCLPDTIDPRGPKR